MERLSGFRVVWHDSVEEALQSTNGDAHIFSNELPDAFPSRIFQKIEDRWMELHLHIADGKISEQLVSATLPESSVFDHPHPLDQRVEIHESYRRWQEAWAPHWMSGAILTIDYGDLSRTLYHRRPAGSLRGYAAQQRLSGNDVFKNPGFCDITADVNFTDLEKWGSNLGWSTETNCTLLAFLKEQGATASLPMPFFEAGEAFRVLIQRRSNK
jgi:SAM-dependent MidA family methyltransferase